MKIKEGYILRELADSCIVVAVGPMARHFNAMVRLNATAAFLWRRLETETTEAELLNALQAEYQVGSATAVECISSFLDQMRKDGFIVA